MIRVLVVSPRSGARTALARAVAQDPGLALVGAAASLAASAESRPDVIVLDPGRDVLPSLPVLLERAPRGAAPPVVVLLDDLEPDAGARALRGGARAVLARSATPEEIRAAVRASAAGLASLPAGFAVELLDRHGGGGTHAPVESRGSGLTQREREILALLGEGLVNKAIAVRLGISDHTVKTHLAAIYEKLAVSNRAEAVATGLRRGLVML